MPNQPATPTHTVRIEDDLWDAAMRKAHDEGTTLTEVIRKALVAFLRD